MTLARARIDASTADVAHRPDPLADYAILDTPPEDTFDALAELTARACETPVAVVSFLDGDREWVKAAHGAELEAVDRQRSFGDVAVSDAAGALVVADAATDPRFAGHPWVAHGPRARFYAAVPLRTPGGVAVGTVAAIDTHPRGDGGRIAESLRTTARVVEGMLEGRREAVLAGALVCVVGVDGRFIRVSRAWEELLGCPADELVGRPFLDFVHPADVARTSLEAAECNAGRGTRGFENRYVCSDGEIRWLAWQSNVVPDEGVIYAVAKDMTELRKSEERYRLLAENATDLIGQWDLEARLTYLSSASSTLLGYAPEELVGRDGYELIHPEDHPAVISYHESLLRGSDRVRAVFRIRHRDGHWVWTESVARLLLDDDGNAVGIQTATRDMTDAKRAMDALQRAEERFRKAFDEGPVGMAIVSLRGTFQRVNRALTEVLGYSERDLIGMGYEDLLHAEAAGTDAVRELLAGDTRSLNVEERLMRRDGTPVWISLSVSLMRDTDGDPVAFLAQFLDVSQRHRAEAESRRAREAAERANRAKSQFLARMSHELRTPLNAILGFAQLLQLEDLPDDQRESAARIVRGGRHLLEVINDVLDISRIEAGELLVELAPVDVSAAIDETVLLVTPLAGQRGMTVRMDLEDGAIHARADRHRLEQVLLNLFSNAIKYAPEGSEVLVRSETADGRVRIAVIDQGPGISDDEAEQIFKPFERLERHGAVEGTGLGLALSRNLVRAMGGEIGVRGSEFWLELPASEPARQFEREAEPTAGAAIVSEPRTLLYIEDSPSNAAFVDRVMEMRPSVELILARDGATGLRLANERRPDAILLDMTLPDMPGEQLLVKLKAEPRTAGIPVVVVSADAGPERAEAAMAAGADAYQTKPLELTAFIRALDEALKK